MTSPWLKRFEEAAIHKLREGLPMTGFYATPERLAQLANNHILLEGGEPDYSQLVERFRKLYAENRP